MQLIFFRLHLVLHACVARFDVTGTAQKFLESKRGLTVVASGSGGASTPHAILSIISCWAAANGRDVSASVALEGYDTILSGAGLHPLEFS